MVGALAAEPHRPGNIDNLGGWLTTVVAPGLPEHAAIADLPQVRAGQDGGEDLEHPEQHPARGAGGSEVAGESPVERVAGALTRWNQLSGPLLAGLLLFPTLGMAAAPVNSWAARRAALPARLRERRATEYRRDRRAFAAGIATGGAVAVLGVSIAAVVLLFTGHQQVQTPNLVAPAQGSPAAPAAPATPSSTPSTSPSATATSTPSPSASPTTTTTPTPSTTATPSPTSSATSSASASPTGSSTVPGAAPTGP